MIPEQVTEANKNQTVAKTATQQDIAWYHGSPAALYRLAAGSTVTPERDLARVFAHKPGLVELRDDGVLRHNGSQPGYLYVVEGLARNDLQPHPRSTMPGHEWLTRRELPLRLLERTDMQPQEMLTPAEEHRLRQTAVHSAAHRLEASSPDDNQPAHLPEAPD